MQKQPERVTATGYFIVAFLVCVTIGTGAAMIAGAGL